MPKKKLNKMMPDGLYANIAAKRELMKMLMKKKKK